MNQTKNNWFKHWYDSAGIYNTSYSNNGVQNLSFKDALFYNAEETINEYHDETFEIMFSGGVDSELVLRVYKDLGKKINVNIFRYEKDYNLYDVSFAIVVSEKLGLSYKIIDFDLENFYVDKAREVYEIAKCSHARALPQLVFMHYVEGIPIYSEAVPRWYRPNSDYSVKAEWIIQDFEYEISWDRYALHYLRPAIMQWFRFTPEIQLGWMNTNWFKDLTNDRLIGKLGVNSTKYLGYQEVYPDIIPRQKKSGFESAEHIVNKFQKTLEINGKYLYAQTTTRLFSEFYRELTGKEYVSINAD